VDRDERGIDADREDERRVDGDERGGVGSEEVCCDASAIYAISHSYTEGKCCQLHLSAESVSSKTLITALLFTIATTKLDQAPRYLASFSNSVPFHVQLATHSVHALLIKCQVSFGSFKGVPNSRHDTMNSPGTRNCAPPTTCAWGSPGLWLSTLTWCCGCPPRN